jgi:hypothetical protein
MLKLSIAEQHALQEYTAQVQQWGWRVELREEGAGEGRPLHMLTHMPEVFQTQLNATELKVRQAPREHHLKPPLCTALHVLLGPVDVRPLSTPCLGNRACQTLAGSLAVHCFSARSGSYSATDHERCVTLSGRSKQRPAGSPACCTQSPFLLLSARHGMHRTGYCVMETGRSTL